MDNSLVQAETLGRVARTAASAFKTFSTNSASSLLGAVPCKNDLPVRQRSSFLRLSSSMSPLKGAMSVGSRVKLAFVASRLGAFLAITAICSSVGFMAGKSSTSLMLFLLVKNMAKRSIPSPNPPVGGNPCSKAVTKESSITIASSSPALPSRRASAQV